MSGTKTTVPITDHNLAGRFTLLKREDFGETIFVNCVYGVKELTERDIRYIMQFYNLYDRNRHITSCEPVPWEDCFSNGCKHWPVIRITSRYDRGTHYDPVTKQYRLFNGEEPISRKEKPETSQGLRRLDITCTCMCAYTSSILVPEGLTLEDAVAYAKARIKEIPVSSGYEHIEDSDEIDEENCSFHEEP